MPHSAREFYDRHAETHDDQNQLDDLPDAFHTLLETFTDALDGTDVLDAGCGAGRDTEYFHNNDLTPIGIDISQKMIERAQCNRAGDYTQMDMRDLSFEDNSFDGVWCPASIFFVPPIDMMKTLLEFQRVLRPDGVARIGFKLGNGEHTAEKWGDEVTEYHISEDDARQFLEMARFHIEDATISEVGPNRTFANFLCRAGARYPQPDQEQLAERADSA